MTAVSGRGGGTGGATNVGSVSSASGAMGLLADRLRKQRMMQGNNFAPGEWDTINQREVAGTPTPNPWPEWENDPMGRRIAQAPGPDFPTNTGETFPRGEFQGVRHMLYGKKPLFGRRKGALGTSQPGWNKGDIVGTSQSNKLRELAARRLGL